MTRHLLLTAYLLTLCLLASAQTKKVIDKVAGTVGAELLLQSEIEEQYSYLLEKNKGALPPDARCLIAEQLITQKLLLNQAKLDSIKVTDDEVEARVDAKIETILSYMNNDVSQLEAFYGQTIGQLKEQVREDEKNQMLVQRAQQKIMSDVTITPSEVKVFFSKIPYDSLPYFNSEVELGEIAYKPKINEAQRRIAREKIEDIRQQITEKGEGFAQMAEKYSEDPGSARVGGDLGWAKRGKFVPEFEAAAYKLEKEEISPVIESEFGFHIIQLLERRGNSIHARHILIKPQITEEDIEKARITLDSISHRINSDSLRFAAAVKMYSDKNAQSFNDEGRMFNAASNNTFFETSDLDPEIFFSIDTLKIGKTSSAIQFTSPAGETYFRLIKLISRTQPHKASLKTDYQKIQSAALEQKKSGLISNWVAQKLEKTYIAIDEKLMGECPSLKKFIKSKSSNP